MKTVLTILVIIRCSFSYELLTFPDTTPYEQKKQLLRQKHTELSTLYDREEISIDSVGKAFEIMMVNELIPYWYGLPWEFHGHSNSPDSGTVACGYFVSTTLKHLGVNVNRYRLAQQSAKNEIKSLLGTNGKIHYFQNSDSVEEKMMETLSDGLYVVGLDFHVGFILKKEKELYFIHSNYRFPAMVIFESVTDSDTFHESKSFYIGGISKSTWFMKRWLQGTRITVIMD